jgi:hypothetical protein
MRYSGKLWLVTLLAACSGDNLATRQGSGTNGGVSSGTAGGSANSSAGTISSGVPGGSSGGTAASSGGTPAGSGGSAANPDASVANQACSPLGATRSCCSAGTQTCGGNGEFPIWGPCLDAKGAPANCTGKCAAGEFGPGCDAGVDSGTKCGPGEFGPGCDAGTKCGLGNFGPGCDASVPPPPPLCTDPTVSNEPEILAGYSPASGQSVGENGQIKVWVNDEHAPIIAPNEQIDPNTGLITTPGDRTAKAADGYLWEPALYIAPQTAENGGTPHFPQSIKGWYNNMPPAGGGRPAAGAGVQVPGMDAPPAGTSLSLQYTGEDIWDVSALGLSPGTYIGEFVIHDGDRDRAVGCVTIVITAAD